MMDLDACQLTSLVVEMVSVLLVLAAIGGGAAIMLNDWLDRNSEKER